MNFANELINWYQKNKRSLPWRNTKKPYKIWLSEIILQQTRVDQGKSYYLKFEKEFPTVSSLAKADEQKVLNMWQGLGYYSRARNLKKAADQVISDFNGVFPTDYKELLKLKGVGKYTAAAVASFSKNERVPVVDGNVYRVISRYLNIDEPINTPKSYKIFSEAALELMENCRPDEFNQAIMEFGALHCTPTNPKCNECPLSYNCTALALNIVKDLPVKKKKSKVKERFFNFIITNNASGFAIEKRNQKGIWQNLYQFPMIETSNHKHEFSELKKLIETDDRFENHKVRQVTQIGSDRKHLLSHQRIWARFYEVEFDEETNNQKKLVRTKSLEHYPIPRLIERFVEEEAPHYLK
ncbi:A/G-specific adenine glycosylase [Salibacter sp.]|uniref:A/G-specific adenine glycosylase n=1 Tax=Salibacter sp. TaxID=2010995 RepID=UPI00287068BD|nr:A/G-specific adenine glycosylase [Salibacter sp.]MDR9488085.1 A/G-specific adenine glycosylase [Salibacter sp.]